MMRERSFARATESMAEASAAPVGMTAQCCKKEIIKVAREK
jgi:hypothetical protein